MCSRLEVPVKEDISAEQYDNEKTKRHACIIRDTINKMPSNVGTVSALASGDSGVEPQSVKCKIYVNIPWESQGHGMQSFQGIR